MDTVTISPKFQVVIPKDIRTRLKLRAGQKVHAMVYEGRIELVPVRPARQLKRLPPRDRHDGVARARPDVNVVDSSGWLEYFADGPNAAFFTAAIESPRTSWCRPSASPVTTQTRSSCIDSPALHARRSGHIVAMVATTANRVAAPRCDVRSVALTPYIWPCAA